MKEFAIIEEILQGGYLNVGTILPHLESNIVDKIRNNNIPYLFNLKMREVGEDLALLIHRSSGFRYLLIDSLHDFMIRSVQYLQCNDNQFLIFELDIENCFHLLKMNSNEIFLIVQSAEASHKFELLKQLKLPVCILGHTLKDCNNLQFTLGLEIVGLEDILLLNCNEVYIIEKH